MKHCAVICEYNPFHNGHLYQLQKIRAETNCDGIICIMSGDFVQRAEPAVMNKFSRAECALRHGADLVTELPVMFAIGNGETFARGAIDIVTALPNVKYLAMGCETDSPELLFKFAEIQLDESSDFKKRLSQNLDSGVSYAAAYAEATAKTAEKLNIAYNMSSIILSKPNNILCIEYIKSLKRKNSDIMPIPIKRNNINTISSSEIRKTLSSIKKNIDRYMPPISLDMLKTAQSLHPVDLKTYSDIVINNLRNITSDELSVIPDISEGIENRIIKEARKTTDFNRLIKQIKSKRYTESRLKRICLQATLGINQHIMRDISIVYSPVLGIKESFKHYLSKLSTQFYIGCPNNQEQSNSLSLILQAEKKAYELYALLTHNDDYKLFNRLITV